LNLQKIIGVGCDLVDINRIKKAIEDHPDAFIKKIFTKEEISYCQSYQDPFAHYAARFAAKEAVAKALGVGLGKMLGWQNIQILSDRNKKPSVELLVNHSHPFYGVKFELSLSHEKEFALAFVIAIEL